MYIKLKNAAVIWGVWWYRYPKLHELVQLMRSNIPIVPITFNYRKYIYGCIATNTVAYISHCCNSVTHVARFDCDWMCE